MANASTEITFQATEQPDDDQVDIKRDLSLDDDMNSQAYDEDSKTSFLPREIAYLRFISNSDSDYTISASYGNIRRIARNIPYEFTDEIDFINADEESLSFFPDGAITSWEWVGRDGGTPIFAGITVRLPAPTLSILRVTYKVLGDRLTLVSDRAIDVIAAVTQDGVTESLKVAFSEAEDGEDLDPQAYDLEVVNLCTNEKVDGARVYLDGVLVGTTNSAGVISLGLLVPGQSYDIQISKTGYIDSNLDALLNDSFTVPTS